MHSLNRLIIPSKSLTSISLDHPGRLPFAAAQLLQILSHTVETLRTLNLIRVHGGYNPCRGLDLTKFRSLRVLRIESSLLLGTYDHDLTTFKTIDHSDLTQLIRSRLPPNLRALILDGLTAQVSPYPGLRQQIFDLDLELMECLLEHKEYLAPDLECLFMYYLENMVEPKTLYDLADKVGVKMTGLYASDEFGWRNEQVTLLSEYTE